MKGEGMLKMETSSDDHFVDIKLQDTGPGIPENNLKRIFNPFYRTKPVKEETGLGLSISYSIIEKDGGNFAVSNNVDKGVTFAIKLLIEGVKN
tara:strand:+ start:5866 stop:6144 length:279 start_codon:yes stop_codon:yes gene_type:complete